MRPTSLREVTRLFSPEEMQVYHALRYIYIYKVFLWFITNSSMPACKVWGNFFTYINPKWPIAV